MEKMLQRLSDLISEKTIIYSKSVLTADEAAKYMGVSRSYLYKLTMQQKIPFSKPLGKMCYFNRVELEKWLLSNRVATADELQDRAQAYCGKGGKL
jgi:excisionase family DNA binding protein